MDKIVNFSFLLWVVCWGLCQESYMYIANFYVFKVIYAKKIEGNETPKAEETVHSQVFTLFRVF